MSSVKLHSGNDSLDSLLKVIALGACAGGILFMMHRRQPRAVVKNEHQQKARKGQDSPLETQHQPRTLSPQNSSSGMVSVNAPRSAAPNNHPAPQVTFQQQTGSSSGFAGATNNDNNVMMGGKEGRSTEFAEDEEEEWEARLAHFKNLAQDTQPVNGSPLHIHHSRMARSSAAFDGSGSQAVGAAALGTAQPSNTSSGNFPAAAQEMTLDDVDSIADSTSAVPGPASVGYRRTRRTTVCGPSTNLDETRKYRPVNTPKSHSEQVDLVTWLQRCHLFAHLDEDELKALIMTMERVEFNRSDYVTVEGEIPDGESQRFYIIAEGEVAVIRSHVVSRVLRRGSFFGERAIMFVQQKYQTTHRVETQPCVCFALTADDYRHLVIRAAVQKRELYEGFLDRVAWLSGLTLIERLQLADCLQPVVYEDGDYLIEYNTIGAWMFLIIDGQVEVFGREQGEVVHVCYFGVGDCVGELEFLNNHRTVADVRANGRVKAARLLREHFELCMGPIVDVLRRSVTDDKKYAYYRAFLTSSAQ